MKIKLTALLFVLAATPSPAGWKVASGFSMDFAHVPMEKIQLADHLYFLHGSGANMCVSVGPDGILLVDCEFPPMSPRIQAAINTIQPGPVRFLIDTHFHVDHSGGNAYFAKTGTIIIAQDNVRARLVNPAPRDWYFSLPTPPIDPFKWPLLTYDRTMTLHINGEDVILFHDVPAHTDGDTVVYFPRSNVIHMGDIFINGLYPIIDLGSKGTIDGYFPVLDHALSLINDQTKVIAGHGPVATKKDLQFYRDMLATIRHRVKAMISEGKTLDEIVAANPSKEFDANWASDRVGPKAITKMIYESLVMAGGPQSPQPPKSPFGEDKAP